MEIRDILLFLHAEEPNEAAAELAVLWARAQGACVTACCLCADPPASIADSYAIGAAADNDVLDRRRDSIDLAAGRTEAAFRQAAAAAGLEAHWTVPDPNEPADDLALRARFFDLTILSHASAADHPARELAEALALRSGGPCVIVPFAEPLRPTERIVVAWNGSPQARRALDDALPLLKRAKAVQLLVMGDDPRWIAHCQPELMLQHLARHDIAARLRITPDGDLPTACAEFDGDLLVMGAYSHLHASEVLLGGVTRAALAGFPLPVLLSR